MHGVKLGVKRAPMDQRMMGTVILNPAMAQHDVSVHPSESRYSVRDKQDRLLSKVVLQICEDVLLATQIQCRCGFVEKHHFWLLKNSSCQCEALPLPSGKSISARTYWCVPAKSESAHNTREIGNVCCIE